MGCARRCLRRGRPPERPPPPCLMQQNHFLRQNLSRGNSRPAKNFFSGDVVAPYPAFSGPRLQCVVRGLSGRRLPLDLAACQPASSSFRWQSNGQSKKDRVPRRLRQSYLDGRDEKSFVRLTHADSRLCGHRPLAVPWKLMHGGVENRAAVRQLGAPKLGHQDGRF